MAEIGGNTQSQHSDQIDAEENVNPNQPGVSSVVGVLAKTVSGLQQNMSVVFQRMAGSLQQSLSMMESMNTCMEEYVRSSIRMSVSVKSPQSTNSSCEHRLRLFVTVRTIGKLPIPAIKLSIILKPMISSAEIPQLFVGPEPEAANKRQKLGHRSLDSTSSPP